MKIPILSSYAEGQLMIGGMQAQFLKNFDDHGFKDKSSMLRAAIDHFKKEIELESLRKSADLYSEIYSEEDELKDLTEAALTGL